MSVNEIIRAMIREELVKAIKQQLTEANFKKGETAHNSGKRKEGSRSKGTNSKGKYTSAGSTPTSGKNRDGKRPWSSSIDAKKRDVVGKKILNAIARGNTRGTGKAKGEKAKESERYKKQVAQITKKNYGDNPTPAQKRSAVWALASIKVGGGRRGGPKS